MKKSTIVFYIVWLFAIAVLQPTLIQWLKIFGVTPELFLVFVISASVIRGKTEGAVWGFVFGLVLDFSVGRMIGLNGILYMLTGYATGRLNDNFLTNESPVFGAVFVFIASLICGIVYSIAYSFVWGSMGIFNIIVRMGLLRSIYNALTALILFVPVRKSFELIKDRSYF